MQKAYICGCVRNCAQHLSNVFANIDRIGSLFAEVRILIAYDESDDGSLDVLEQLASTRANMRILLNAKPLTHIRTQNISNARNLLLDTMRHDPDHEEFTYFMMIDCDDVCSGNMNLAYLAKYIESDEMMAKWDSISFNRKDYYDVWAFSNDPHVFSCWNWESRQVSLQWVHTLRKWIQTELAKLTPDDLMTCYGAFNGFAVYRMSIFLKCRYEWNMRTVVQYIPREWLIRQSAILNKRIYFAQTMDDCEHRYFHLYAHLEHGAKNRISPLCLFDDDVAN